MKTIGRIVVILVAVLIVAGGTWLIGYKMGSSQNVAFAERGQRGGFDFEGDRPVPGDGTVPNQGEFPDGQGFPNRGRDGDGERGGFNISGIAGFAQTLIPITLIIAAVVLIQSVVTRFRRGKNKLPSDTTPPDVPQPSDPAAPEGV